MLTYELALPVRNANLKTEREFTFRCTLSSSAFHYLLVSSFLLSQAWHTNELRVSEFRRSAVRMSTGKQIILTKNTLSIHFKMLP
jgi:hypothetical protein